MGQEARNFSSTKAYTAGELVLYNGLLYRFTSNHSAGAWTGSDAAAVDNSLEQDVTRILTGEDRAQSATAYAETIVFEPAQISGTRYKYILTSAQA